MGKDALANPVPVVVVRNAKRTYLEMVERRGKFPSAQFRQCTPATGFTGDVNREIIHQWSVWWHRHKQGRAFDNNTGFFLPDGSMFTPDAAYIRREKSRRITQEEGGQLLRVVPDFVVELLSPFANGAA